MRTHRHPIAVLPALLLGFVTLTGCGESTVDPSGQQLSFEEEAELALFEDEEAREAALELTEAAHEDLLAGVSLGVGRAFIAQATVRLASADAALHAGDRRRALDETREARRFLARAIVAAGGEEAVEALIERIEDLAAQIDDEDDDVFEDPAAVRARLEELAAEARAYLEEGDLVRAADRALLAEQIVRHLRRLHVTEERAELAVSLATTALSLADSLVESGEMPVRQLGASNVRNHQNRWLVHAEKMLAKATRALEQGHYARAVHFAWHANWSALRAVILPGGVTQAELDALVEVALDLHAEAEIALGDEPTELEERLFGRAGRLIEIGEAMIADGHKRGAALVWRGAVISRWLVGD